MDDLYTHTPLGDQRSIRILSLAPAASTKESLCCELIEVILDKEDPPNFEAISYAWDSKLLDRRLYVLCHGKKLPITQNCEAALRCIRSKVNNRRLWIDSICIDQSSVWERNHQVSIMGEIYTSAQRVLVWLGEATLNTTCTFQHILEFACRDHNDSDDRRFLEERMEQIIKGNATKEPVDTQTGHPWSIMGEVFCCTWFKRMWTLQEVILADPNQVIVMCGKETISWNSILQALECMRSIGFDHHRLILDAVGLHRILGIYVTACRKPGGHEFLRTLVNTKKKDKPMPLISNIFAEARKKRSTDPRDKVFALYGIFQELGIDFPCPDYAKSVKQIYQEATKAVIKHDQELDVLYLVYSPRRRPDLPSWVPDWNDSWETVGVYPSLLAPLYQATDSKSHFSFSSDGRNLIVLGKIVDKVTVSTNAVPVIEENPRPYGPDIYDLEDPAFLSRTHELWQIFKEWAQCIDRVGLLDRYPSGGHIIRAFYCTILQELPDRGPSPEHYPLHTKGNIEGFKLFMKWYDTLLSGEEELLQELMKREMISKRGELKEEVISTIALWLIDDPQFKQFHHDAWEILRGKSFFMTEGGYMGTGEGMVQEGDVVVLLAGMEMPMILRPDDDFFLITAHAYVHGIMDGEAWPDHLDELEMITLV